MRDEWGARDSEEGVKGIGGCNAELEERKRDPDGAEYIKIHDRMSGYGCHQQRSILSVSDTRRKPKPYIASTKSECSE